MTVLEARAALRTAQQQLAARSRSGISRMGYVWVINVTLGVYGRPAYSGVGLYRCPLDI
jgi:hypothetical protein